MKLVLVLPDTREPLCGSVCEASAVGARLNATHSPYLHSFNNIRCFGALDQCSVSHTAAKRGLLEDVGSHSSLLMSPGFVWSLHRVLGPPAHGHHEHKRGLKQCPTSVEMNYLLVKWQRKFAALVKWKPTAWDSKFVKCDQSWLFATILLNFKMQLCVLGQHESKYGEYQNIERGK